MNFLVTNDDGIAAPGLWAVVRSLRTLGRVLVVAPAGNYSGYGPALPPARELSFQYYCRDGADLTDVTAYALQAPPATCVQVGLSGAFSRHPIDFVVSGINDVLNLGQDVLYSGTVGAAMTAHVLGLPAIAVSLDFGRSGTAHWETAAWGVQEMISSWLSGSRSGSAFHNLNVPNRPVHELAGVRITRLSANLCLTNYHIAPCSDNVLRLSRLSDRPPIPAGPGTDAWAVAHGYLSVTPLRVFPEQIESTPCPAMIQTAPVDMLFACVAAG